MEYSVLGKTGLRISRLSFGASPLGGIAGPVDEQEAIRAVHTALDCGINYIDVAPAYAATRSEAVLGKALRDIPRNRYYLSTKVGKYTAPGTYGNDTLDYSRKRIRESIAESAARLGVEYFEILYLHDIEYQGRHATEHALTEGYESLIELKKEGRIGAFGFGLYPIDLWERLFKSVSFDVALVHNHYCLNDTSLLRLLPLATDRQIGVVNAAPFASGMLTDNGAAAWHPATADERRVFKAAAAFCRQQGTTITDLAIQFSSQNPQIPVTLFGSPSPSEVLRNIELHEKPCDMQLVEAVQEILQPVMNKQWNY